MINDIDQSFGISVQNGRMRAASDAKTPERSPWELLGWAILEQAVDDLAAFARWGIIGPNGNCLPWPAEVKRRIKWTTKGPQYFWNRVPRTINGLKGPNDHKSLKGWFLSAEAETFCDLIGCRLPAQEIFWTTIKNNCGGPVT